MASIAFASVGKLIELLNTASAGGDAFVRVLSINRLALGIDPFHPSYIIDISREILAPCNQDEPITLEMSARHHGSSAPSGYTGKTPGGQRVYCPVGAATSFASSLPSFLHR